MTVGYFLRRGRPSRLWLFAAICLATSAASAADSSKIIFPASVEQGAMVIGKVPPVSRVIYHNRLLEPTPYGTIVFGISRDANGVARLSVTPPDGDTQQVEIQIRDRDWPVERVDGVPPESVKPSSSIRQRIDREQAEVAQVRRHSGRETGFAQDFIWPVKGRISGRFGNQRVYNGTPGPAHSGMDIAVAMGTPVHAPAAGKVVFAKPDLYLTGGTVLIDHGYGIGSNFLHLSSLAVKAGQSVKQGQVIGKVGATGRATGPHLHWGMTWYNTRIDPLLVLARGQTQQIRTKRPRHSSKSDLCCFRHKA